MPVKPRPDGYHTVTPYLVVPDVEATLSFVKRAFDAAVIERIEDGEGNPVHAEVRIGDSVIMMGWSRGDASMQTKAMLYLYVEDADTLYKRAIDAGATSVREMRNEFYGDRAGGVMDAAGNQWWVSTHVEDVAPDELQRRMAAMAPK